LVSLIFPKLLKLLISLLFPKSVGNVAPLSMFIHDRAQNKEEVARDQLVHYQTKGPKTLLVYSRWGKKGNGG
jgi:hypothetical protein